MIWLHSEKRESGKNSSYLLNYLFLIWINKSKFSEFNWCNKKICCLLKICVFLSLNRWKSLIKKLLKKSPFQLENLPLTKRAATQHVFQTYTFYLRRSFKMKQILQTGVYFIAKLFRWQNDSWKSPGPNLLQMWKQP